MMEFLKRIFQKGEPQPRIEEISFSDLDKWIRSNSGFIVEQAKQDSKKLIVEFNVRINRLHWAAEALKNAELQNPDIPIKAKQMMEGSREHYVNAVLKWAESIKYGGNPEFKDLRNFISSFDESLDELSKSTAKSFAILQEFFANESGKVAMTIKEINDLAKSLNSKINSQRMLDLEKIKGAISDLKERLRQKEALEKECGEINTGLEDTRKKKEELMKEVENFKQSGSFVNYKKIKEEREALLKEVNSCEDVITQSFSAIERALRKYSHIAFEHEQIILNYIVSPLDTLVSDKRFMILDILEKTKENLERGVLKLEQAKKDRIMEELSKMSKEFFMQLLEEYSKAMKRIKEIDKQIKELNLSNTMNDYNSKLNNMDFSIKNLEKSHAKLRDAVEKLNIPSLALDLESLIKGTFNEIKIRV